MGELKRTPLFDLHRELGARIVPFAGWEMPVQYKAGIIAEHLHCRAAAALFDVSHMGQVRLDGPNAAAALERLVPADIVNLAPGRARYTQLTSETGGILDDLIVSNAGDHLFLVVNAGCRDADIAHLRASLEPEVRVTELADRALLALQGPAAATVLARHAAACAELPFMGTAEMAVDGLSCRVSRLGYTGEDGYEISVAAEDAERLARMLLAHEEVQPAGLGARDSLRLEAGLPLYGHEIDTTTTPVEAGLAWSIQKRRREAGGFAGAETILRQLAEGPARKLVGIRPEGRAPAREGTEIQDPDGRTIGRITSGGFGPSVGAPVAMGYVDAAHAAPGTALNLLVRGKPLPARVAALPFVPRRYHR
ncbi:glycine cleavage system aminomethyltransferase GcvT [Benzoatithermus flavus]|uniref:aminomethyltransferase n=1 Tax=Benzoatithermus flavus TaxID=3108223 RepID=A0ABU8XQZ5_9PROT